MNDAARDNKYQYNGKEIQDDWSLNLYAYGARYYDAALGRFTGVDPIADQFPHVTTYNYAENEPVGNIDLHGLQKLSFKKLVDAGKNAATNTAVFAAGMVNAIGSNMLFGVGRGDPQNFGGSADYAEAGQRAGDVVSVALGGVEMAVSAAGLAGEGILAPITGGASALAMAPTAAIGAHGFSTSQSALSNLLGGDRVYAKNPGSKGGIRAGKDFTKKGKQEVIGANKQENGGTTICEDCGVTTVPGQKSQKGVTPPVNETQVDHIFPKSKGGDGSPANGQVLCRGCNIKKSDKIQK